MADFCFVHAADLHLDAPFKGIGQTAPAVAAALRDASLDAFDALVQLCLERGAAFLVLGGDLYDGPEHGLRAQLRLRDGLSALSDEGIFAFIVHGNHDPLEGGWSAVTEGWPERAVVFPADRVGAAAVTTRSGEMLALVQGISYSQRDVRENLARRFSRQPWPGFQVGLLHCNVGGREGHEDYSPCSLDDLRRARLDYWALGHIHAAGILSGRPHSDEPWVVYPGSLQSRSPKPSELGPKGAFVVEVHDDRVAAIEHVACDRVRFATVEVDMSTLGDKSTTVALRDALHDAAEQLMSGCDGRSVIVRGRISGRTKISGLLKRQGTVDELLVSLRETAPCEGQFLWWDALVDETAQEMSIESLATGGDFVADVISAGRNVVVTQGHGMSRESAGSAAPPVAAEVLRAVADGLPQALRRRAEDLLLSHPLLLDSLAEDALGVALDSLGVGVEEDVT